MMEETGGRWFFRQEIRITKYVCFDVRIIWKYFLGLKKDEVDGSPPAPEPEA